MTKVSFGCMRLIAAILLLWLVTCAANHYLNWGLFGRFDKQVLAATLCVALLLTHRFGPGLQRQMKAYQRLKRIRAAGQP